MEAAQGACGESSVDLPVGNGRGSALDAQQILGSLGDTIAINWEIESTKPYRY
jgi:hypothetical protein